MTAMDLLWSFVIHDFSAILEILVVKFAWSVSRHTSIVDRGEIRVPSFEIESSRQRCLKSQKLSAQGLS